MPDTKRSLSALQALLADNTAGDISAQDMRDVLVSTMLLNSLETSITTTATLAIGSMNVCSGTTSDYTITLPTASGNAGQFIGVRMSSALTKLVTIDGNASETIDGSLTRIMWACESAILISDGTQWCKIAGKSVPMLCLAYSASTQSGIGDFTFTKANIDTFVCGQSSILDTTNKRMMPLRSGIYSIAASAVCGASGNGVGAFDTKTAIYKNGSILLSSANDSDVATDPTTPCVTLESLTTSDYIECFGYRFSKGGETREIQGGRSTFLSITEVAPW